MPKKDLTKSVYDKHLEVQYNEKYLNTTDGIVHIQLKGKIFCPVLNHKISSIVCCKMMDKEGWPRSICPDVCENQAHCFISKSIKKHVSTKNKGYNK